MKRTALCIAIMALSVSIPLGATPKPDHARALHEARNHHLNPIKIQGFDDARGAENFDLKAFDSLMVVLPTLSFNRHWLREHRSDMSRADEKRLRESYTQVLQQVLEKQLSERTGLVLASSVKEKTLVVRPTLSDFRLNAPDLSFKPLTKDYVNTVGAARIHLQLENSDGEILTILEDHRETASFGVNDIKRTNRAENLRDFKNLYRRWTERLGDYLMGETQ